MIKITYNETEITSENPAIITAIRDIIFGNVKPSVLPTVKPFGMTVKSEKLTNWGYEEDELLIKLKEQELSNEEIAKRLHRTIMAIEKRFYKIRGKAKGAKFIKTHWTEKEDEILHKGVSEGLGAEQIASQLNRTTSSVGNRVWLFKTGKIAHKRRDKKKEEEKTDDTRLEDLDKKLDELVKPEDTKDTRVEDIEVEETEPDYVPVESNKQTPNPFGE